MIEMLLDAWGAGGGAAGVCDIDGCGGDWGTGQVVSRVVRGSCRRFSGVGILVSVDLSHYKERLLAKEQELLAEIQRLQAEAREPREGEVRDEIDEVTSDGARATAFEESTREWQTLQQVREALQRIEDGTFGKCIDCGRQIPPARLEAVPWAVYCLEDQEKHDAEQGS